MSYNNAQRATIPTGTKKMFGLSDKIKDAFDDALSHVGILTARRRLRREINYSKLKMTTEFYALHPELAPEPQKYPLRPEDLAGMSANERTTARREAFRSHTLQIGIELERGKLSQCGHISKDNSVRVNLG